MPESVGGLWITQYDFTRAFGVEPASASGRAVLGAGSVSSGLSVGQYVAYSFGALVFYGILSRVTVVADRESGREYEFQIVDNRVRLPWKVFFGQYNIAEPADVVHERPLLRPPSSEFSAGSAVGDDAADFGAGVEAPSPVPGGSVDNAEPNRGRVFSHIVPSQWAAQVRSYTTEPVSAAQILRSAFKSALGSFGFTLNLHPDQNEPVFDVDANSGMTLAALLQKLCEEQGLQVTLDGSRTLRFERRGQGTLVIPGPPAQLSSDGEAMSTDPTKVRVVGDRTLVQVNNISLEPDWKQGWEKFISEPAWLDEVERTFGPFSTDSAGRAERAAKAREVTMRQYLSNVGSDSDNLADRGRWGKASRLNMPVWHYLNSIVYRSYRVPRDRMLYGLPMCGLEIHESLLAGVGVADEGGQIHYRSEPVELYPQAAACVIVRGQPLDLLVAAERDSVVRRLKNLREEWSEIADFTVDASNHSIRFASPMFIDGNPASGESVLLYPNKGEGGFANVTEGLGEDSDYLGLVVPNPGYKISPAEVKISLTFRLGKFFKDFGTGQRWTTHNVPDLAEHLLDTNNSGSISHALVGDHSGGLSAPTPPSGLKEIRYDDGETAAQKAERQAAGAIQKSGVERSGQYVRRGAAGTAVSGVIDRVTISITREKGIEETVEFSKPRVSREFVSSRDFGRRVRTEELFEGQTELRREVQQLRGIAKLDRQGINDPVRSTSHTVISDLFSRPIGGENPAVVTYHDPSSQAPDRGAGGWRAGDNVWLDESGVPSRAGKTWGGVVVWAPKTVDGGEASKFVICATSGTVPMAVKPDTQPGHSVSATPGDWCAAGGSHALGVLAHSAAVPGDGESALALVRLGADATPRCRFAVWMSVETQRLYCAVGTVDVANEAYPSTDSLPIVPKLNGVSLNETPYWDLTGKETGVEYRVVCIFDCVDANPARVELKKVSEDLHLTCCERAKRIATLTFKSVDGGLAIEEFSQDWASDIDRTIDLVSCNSGDCSGSSDDESSGPHGSDGSDDSIDPPDSSDDPEPPSSDDDSSDESSDDDTSSSSGSCGCPLSHFEAYMYSVDGGNCFLDAGGGYVSVVVGVHVGEMPARCGYILRFGIAGVQTFTKVLLGGGSDYGEFITFLSLPNRELTCFAQIEAPLVAPPGASGCCISLPCRVEETVTLPDVCPF